MKVLNNKTRVDFKQLKQSIFEMYPKKLSNLDYGRVETFIDEVEEWLMEEEKGRTIKLYSTIRKHRRKFAVIVRDLRTNEIVAILKNTSPVKNL